MPAIRKLPSGKYQASVRMPDGRRVTHTDPLRRVARQWGLDIEARLRRGDARDPRAGHITVGDWYGRWIAARGVEPGTLEKISSIWRTHCLAQWARWPMDTITRMEAQQWVRVLELKRSARHPRADAPELAASTVHEVVHVMSSLYLAATREHPPIVLINPFGDLDLPRIAPHGVDFYEHAEVEAICEAMLELRPREPQWPVLVELGSWVGLRPGEIFGLAGSRVDWLRGLVQVTQVQTRAGLRAYPKSVRSHRIVPVPPELDTLESMSALLRGRSRDELVFTSTLGGPIDDSRFRNRVWLPALRAAGVRIFPPRIMRHTAASWLVMDGVPLYDVQALLGHESFATTQRYAHLQPDAHSRVIDAWSRRGLAR